MDRFPDSLIAFQRMFPDDDACAVWLTSVRWPEGFACPRCGHDHGWALRGKAHTFECAGCHRQTSVTAGTILHGTKLTLTIWFWAAYLMATHSNGISALQHWAAGRSALSASPTNASFSAATSRAWRTSLCALADPNSAPMATLSVTVRVGNGCTI